MMSFRVTCQVEGAAKCFEVQTGQLELGKISEFSDRGVADELTAEISRILGSNSGHFYLTHNGKLLSDCSDQLLIDNNEVPLVLVPRLLGGKGGFGSMLRAIGAQIEKTTNREACRDLSGRRLRDINEEQRLKKWFAKQKERELEKEEAKKKKLEKLRQFCEGAPLPLTQDPEYNRQRAEMADSVFEAVDKGFEASLTETASTEKTSSNDEEASSSSSASAEGNTSAGPSTSSADGSANAGGPSTSSNVTSTKKTGEPVKEKPVTIKRTFFEEDLDSDVSDSSDSDQEAPAKKAKV